jgi:polyphenol oxidase
LSLKIEKNFQKMPFQEQNSLKIYQFSSLAGEAIRHGIFTRRGGDSPSPWDSLNFGGTVGDDPDRVRKNHDIAFEQVGFSRQDIFDVWQVHGVDVQFAEAPRPMDQPHLKADIIFTERTDVMLFMRFADCVPILLYDPIRRVVGLAHAGWLGTTRHAAQVAVEVMIKRYNSCPENILAGIGPSICARHYEVGRDVIGHIRSAFGEEADMLLERRNGSTHLDLWAANRLSLEAAGVRKIEESRLCTACHPEDWYSHRLQRGKTGRFGVFIGLG